MRPRVTILALLCTALAVLWTVVASPAMADGDHHREHHAAPTNDCTLLVPVDPMTAAGLATPYQLTATDAAHPCDEANVDQSAFVEAAVLDPATGGISIYHPVVVNAGDAPAVAPVTPKLPADAVVAVWFGSNGDVLRLDGPGAHGAVNGLPHDPFGQFSYINAPAFFRAAHRAEAEGKLVVPALGTATDGMACPTTRDFSVVDQDQSDNLATSYRVIAGQVAQNTAATAGMGTALTNGSDEGLLAKLIDPALGCKPFVLPSLDDPGVMVPSLAGNELSADAYQNDPVALVPLTDPMTLHNGHRNAEKTDLYRAGVDMPPIDPEVETPTAYCNHLQAIAPVRAVLDATLFAVPGPQGMTLADFLSQRYAASLVSLGCNAHHHD